MALSVASASAADARNGGLEYHLLAQEFYSVCVKTDAKQSDVAAAAEARSWRPRPAELSIFGDDRVNQAWDGDLASIAVLGRNDAPSLNFAVTSYESADRRDCSFVFDDAPIRTLKIVLESQGLQLAREGVIKQKGQNAEFASYCMDGDDHGVHEITAERKKISGWPGKVGARLEFNRLLKAPDIGPGAAIGFEDDCPIEFTIYDFGPEYFPSPPNIETWLGKKSATPPDVGDELQ